MVQSILNKTINYIETDKLAEKDENYPTIGYDIELEGKTRTLALGQAKYSFTDKNIIYFPIYLIVDDTVKSRVGVYEIYENQLSEKSIFDEDDDIDIDKLGDPLYFVYFFPLLNQIDNELLYKEEIIDKRINKSLQSDGDKLEPKGSIQPFEKYNPSQSTFWIQKFLKDNNYKIKDNEGQGQCLFAAIRDAYKTIKQDISVDQLREIVASKATQDMFDNYRSLYNDTFAPIDALIEKREILIQENKKIIASHRISKDRDAQQQLKIRNQEIIAQAANILIQVKNLKNDLVELDYLHKLKDVTTLELFKEYIKSCDFWGESWAISILEYVLKIKLILLNPIEYDDAIINDTSMDKVIFCGDIIYSKLLEEGSFSPKTYIILDYNGVHFKLITYNGLGAFTFSELPIKIKLLIKKCVPVKEGSYYLISDLVNYVPPALIAGKKTRRKRDNNKKTRKHN